MTPDTTGNESLPAKALVTGGGGFLGSAIVRQLLDAGVQVRTLARRFYPLLEQWGIEQVRGDVADAAAVENACRNMDTVFHVAAKPGVWGPYQDYYRTNVEGTANAIAACRRCGVSQLIHTSSPSVVFNGNDMQGLDETVPYPARYHAHYPKTKALAEQLVRQAAADGLPAIILRPHLIWGPGDNHLIPRIIARADKLARVGNGGNRVDTIFVDNAAEAHILAARQLAHRPELSGRIYFISQDEPIDLWEMIDRILAAAHLPPIQKSVPASVAWAAGALLEMIYTIGRFQTEPPMTRFVANELATAHWFDISAAKSDLGYRPRINMEQGFERLEKWLSDTGMARAEP